MSNYTKATNFTAKDALPAGNSSKVVKGAELDTEFTAIAAAITSKSDSNSPTFTGTPLAPTASAGTNNTQIATTAFAAAAAAAAFPVGGIIMWSGSVASIPSGWVLCNGSNGTPDLRNRFVVGAGSSYAVDATGGSADAIVVSHNHTTDSQGSHTHLSSGPGTFVAVPGGDFYTGVWAGGAGSPAYSTSTAGAHTHTTTTSGSSGTNANLPPYYALCFIMRT